MELCILDSLLGASDADARVSALSSAGNRSSIVGAKTNNGNLLSITDVDTSLANFSNDALVSDALARGVDLREYANQIDVELKQVRRDHVLDYVSKHADLRSLAAQVADCDQMLGNMINLLEGFQVDLNKISVEIRDLQERSNDMNLRLKNRV
ncbi:Vacuolar protein sorting-associated protein 52, partial [Entophlyctis luteolus]